MDLRGAGLMMVFSVGSGDELGTVMLTFACRGGWALKSNMMMVMAMSAEASKRMSANGVMRK
jgi:hypothetical protein